MATLEFIQFSPNVSGEALFEFIGKTILATGDRILSVVVGGFYKDIHASFTVDDDYITVGCYLPAKIGRTYYIDFKTFHGAEYRLYAKTGDFAPPFLEIK